jgi:sulfoxide reductase heme-binding subunit YedZ
MILWEVARASAFVAFACYTVVVAFGIGLSARTWRPPAPVLELHRFLACLGLVALGIHLATLMLDHYARVTVRSLAGLDPRPGVVVGAAALWLAVALPLSFTLKRAGWLSQRAWRSLHYLGYAVWGLALVHGVMSGTDARSAWALAAYGCSASLVAGAAWYRWLERPPRPGPAKRPQPQLRQAAPRAIPAAVVVETEGEP